MPTDAYARKVVEVALRSSPSAHYWMGRLSLRTWCWHTFLPKVSWVSGLTFVSYIGSLPLTRRITSWPTDSISVN